MAEMGSSSPPGGGVLALRWFLLAVMWGLFLAWNFFYWARPTVWFGSHLLKGQWKRNMDSGYFDTWDVNYVLYFVPIILIAIIAPLYMSLPKPPRTAKQAAKEAKPPGLFYRIWSFPVYQTVRVSELFWCTYVAAFLIWQFLVYYCHTVESVHRPTKKKRNPAWMSEWKEMSELFGWTAFFLVNLLFFPVARGSPLLRLINVPFEKAVRYHRWMGYWMLLFTLAHWVSYEAYWHKTASGVHKKNIEWRGFDVAILPGTLCTIVGLIMGATSLGYVRRRWFEVFFSVHQLYVLFMLFLFWHVGQKSGHVFMLPGMFLFIFDRLQRAFQSWSYAGVIATKTMPDGSFQVEVAKHPRHSFHPLNFLFVNVPSISRFQWHPFSLASGPKDSARSFVFHIKPQNLPKPEWTCKTSAKVAHFAPESDGKNASQCPMVKLFKTDGFYGSESNSFKRYPALVMISGGSGIVPLFALLRDILHSHRLGTEVGLPSKIYVHWAVREYCQLATLAELTPRLLCPGYESKVTIEVHAYVTQGTKADASSIEEPRLTVMEAALEHSTVQPMRPQISGWRLSLVLLVTFLGTTLLIGTAYNLIVYSYEPHGTKSGMRWWVRASVLFVSMIAGVIFFGGLSMAGVYLLDRLLGTGAHQAEDLDASDKPAKEGYQVSPSSRPILAEFSDPEDNLLQAADVTFGQRPVVQDILSEVAQQNVGLRIGVLASGPEQLVQGVLSQCRSRNGVFTGQNEAFFDLHTISYVL